MSEALRRCDVCLHRHVSFDCGLSLFCVSSRNTLYSVCICGGGPSDGAYSSYSGGALWNDPGAFANGFKGVCAVFVTAAFSFCKSPSSFFTRSQLNLAIAGTELVGLAASETPNPRETMPGAVKGTFWRIVSL